MTTLHIISLEITKKLYYFFYFFFIFFFIFFIFFITRFFSSHSLYSISLTRFLFFFITRFFSSHAFYFFLSHAFFHHTLFIFFYHTLFFTTLHHWSSPHSNTSQRCSLAFFCAASYTACSISSMSGR